ncbi:MAG: hypothetical protein HDT30_10990 [Clostridiales bacterium]|nr:hypothetical protein [Clostridiales bacterium]
MQSLEVYFEQTTERFKKDPFWKCAAFGLVCILQEYEIYEKLAKDRYYDMSKFLKKTVERFWKAVATGYFIDEKYLLAVEESFFEPHNEWEELALQIVQDISDFFYAVYEKKAKEAIGMQKRQMDLLKKYFSLIGEEWSIESELVKKALSNHEMWAVEISTITNKDKKRFLSEFQTRELTGLFGKAFEKEWPKGIKEKPAKKKIPEIRVTSLAFDKEAKNPFDPWLTHATPEQWVLGEDKQLKEGAYAEYYKNRNYAELCFIMKTRYSIYAAEDYVMNRNAERTRGFWYLGALSLLRSYQLIEKGYPRKMQGSPAYTYEHFTEEELYDAMYRAYASGEGKLVPELLHFSKKQEKTKDLADLFGNVATDELYHRIEKWEDSEIKTAFLAILAEDVKEFRKAMLKRIRHIRKWHDMYRIETTVDVGAYACMRLAKEKDLEVEPIVVAELLDGNMDFSSLEKDWKLPYQEEIDALLRSN